MSYKQFLRKWVTSEKSGDVKIDLRVTNQILLFATDAEQKALGFTILEPRDLNEDMSLKLQKRIESLSNCRFQIVCPPAYLEKAKASFNSISNLAFHASPYFRVVSLSQGFIVKRQLTAVVVDDSPVMIKLMEQILKELEFVQVLKKVSNSEAAVAEIVSSDPDFVTLDMQMPKKNGVQVLKELIPKLDLPVIVVSALGLQEGGLVFEALNCGAFEYIQKPKYEELAEFKEQFSQIILASVNRKKVKSRLNLKNKPAAISASPVKFTNRTLWCIGASTGGTQAIANIVTGLPQTIPPTLIVQHIPPVFSKAFADSLNELCPFRVKEAEDGEDLLPSTMYIAPGGRHMGLVKKGLKWCIALNDSAPVNRFRPSVDFTFLELSQIDQFDITAALLTGMGKDGARGLLELKKKGAYTIAQNEESCAVFGMPRAAIELNAALKISHLDQIAAELLYGTQYFQKAS